MNPTSLPHQNSSYNTFILCFVMAIFGLYVLVFYPGYTIEDTIDILLQGTDQIDTSNWHPPFVTWLWGNIYRVFKGAQAIWLIQTGLFIASLYVFSQTLRSRILQILCLLTALYPPLFTNMPAIWKDNWVMSVTLLCCTFSCQTASSPSNRALILSIIFFILTVLLRIDYFIIALPFVLFAIFMRFREVKKSRFFINKPMIISLCLVFSALFVSMKSVGFTVERKLNPWIAIAIWDIAGTRSFAENQRVDGYNCERTDPLVFGGNRLFKINLPHEDSLRPIEVEAQEIKTAWFQEVTSHPLSYLKHRLCVGKTFFGLGTQYVSYPYPSPVFPESTVAPKINRSQLNHDLYWFFDAHAHGFMYRYWVYLLFSTLLVALLIMFKRRAIFGVILWSTILIAASRFIILPATDFRYGLWIVLGTLALLFYTLDSLFSKGDTARQRKEKLSLWHDSV